jgi:hypothetical protein
VDEGWEKEGDSRAASTQGIKRLNEQRDKFGDENPRGVIEGRRVGKGTYISRTMHLVWTVVTRGHPHVRSATHKLLPFFPGWALATCHVAREDSMARNVFAPRN